jgi:hypothetical protein
VRTSSVEMSYQSIRTVLVPSAVSHGARIGDGEQVEDSGRCGGERASGKWDAESIERAHGIPP